MSIAPTAPAHDAIILLYFPCCAIELKTRVRTCISYLEFQRNAHIACAYKSKYYESACELHRRLADVVEHSSVKEEVKKQIETIVAENCWMKGTLLKVPLLSDSEPTTEEGKEEESSFYWVTNQEEFEVWMTELLLWQSQSDASGYVQCNMEIRGKCLKALERENMELRRQNEELQKQITLTSQVAEEVQNEKKLRSKLESENKELRKHACEFKDLLKVGVSVIALCGPKKSYVGSIQSVADKEYAILFRDDTKKVVERHEIIAVVQSGYSLQKAVGPVFLFNE